MKKINGIITSVVLMMLLGCLTMINAQSNQGTMALSITDVSSDNPQVAAMSDMLMGNETTIYFKDGQSLTKMNMMGGMVKIDVKVDAEENSDMLMDAMGNKIWVSSTKAENDLARAGVDNPLEEMDISYDQNDTKTIAGYECDKMTVTFPDQDGAALEAYITEDLQINAPVIQGVEMEGFAGFPLEYSFNNGMMNMTITTTSFEPTVDETVFDLNTSGYQKMTMQEFMDMMSNMGGGGFGF